MAFELVTVIEESATADSFIIRDASRNWVDIVGGAIATAVLTITSQLNEVVVLNMKEGTRWTEFLSDEGIEINVSEVFSTLDGFPDDYYSFLLTITTTSPATIYTYDNTQGFLAYMREACRRLPLPLNYQELDYEENRKIYQLNILMEGAEADGNVGNITRFEAKVAYISEQLNLRGIVYGS